MPWLASYRIQRVGRTRKAECYDIHSTRLRRGWGWWARFFLPMSFQCKEKLFVICSRLFHNPHQNSRIKPPPPLVPSPPLTVEQGLLQSHHCVDTVMNIRSSVKCDFSQAALRLGYACRAHSLAKGVCTTLPCGGYSLPGTANLHLWAGMSSGPFGFGIKIKRHAPPPPPVCLLSFSGRWQPLVINLRAALNWKVPLGGKWLHAGCRQFQPKMA